MIRRMNQFIYKARPLVTFLFHALSFKTQRMTSLGNEVSPLAHLSSSACSEPFALYRNKERYILSSFQNTLLFPSDDDHVSSSTNINDDNDNDNQDKLATKEVDLSISDEDNQLPSTSSQQPQRIVKKQRVYAKRPKFSHLYRHSSMNEYEPSESHSTLTTCTHRRSSYFIHVLGKNMNQLVIRDANYIVPHRETVESGFTLSLPHSSEITYVSSIGTHSFGAESYVLACAGENLYLLTTQMSTIGEHRRSFDKHTENEQTQDDDNQENHDTCLLFLTHRKTEPKAHVTEAAICSLLIKKEAKLPSRLVKVATTPGTSTYPSCVFLTETGTVLKWSPTQELVPSIHLDFNKSSSSSSSSSENSSSAWTRWSSLECSHDTNTCYFSHRSDLYTIDFRSGSISTTLLSAPTIIKSIKQDLQSPYLVYLCGTGQVDVMDTRHMREPILRRYVPDSHELTQLYRADSFIDVSSATSFWSRKPLDSGGECI